MSIQFKSKDKYYFIGNSYEECFRAAINMIKEEFEIYELCRVASKTEDVHCRLHEYTFDTSDELVKDRFNYVSHKNTDTDKIKYIYKESTITQEIIDGWIKPIDGYVTYRGEFAIDKTYTIYKMDHRYIDGSCQSVLNEEVGQLKIIKQE